MRKRIFWYLLDSIFLIVFNTYFFLLKGAEHNVSIWISYGFIHASYLILLLTPYLVRKGSSSADYGRPLFVITYVHFYLSYLLGVIVFFVNPDSHIIPLLAHITITAIFAIVLLSNLIANEHTAEAIEKREVELVYVKESSSYLKSILNKISDKTLYRKVELLYDLIHGSPIKSSGNVREYEQEVAKQIQKLDIAVSQSDKDAIISISDKILSLAEERNRLLKLSN